MLVILSGLPGVGKTTLAREVARAVGAVHCRVDVLEAALVREQLVEPPVGVQGYHLTAALVDDALAAGRHVVVDAVNPVPSAHAMWREAADRGGVPVLSVEVVCGTDGTDGTDGSGEHERRVRERVGDIPGLVPPTWAQVQAREFAPPPGALVVDTAASPLHALVADLVARVRARPRQATTPARLLAPTHTLGAGEVVLATERLVLRRWRDDDLVPFAALNADPEVARHLGGPADRAASDSLAHYADACFEVYGFGLSAVQRREDGAFCGFVGLAPHRYLPDDVEIGWRLARAAWGQGIATEAARAWVAAARERHGLTSLVSLTVPENTASMAVMRRLGMTEAGRREEDGRTVVVHALDLTAG